VAEYIKQNNLYTKLDRSIFKFFIYAMETIENEIKEIREILREFAIGLTRLEENIERMEKQREESEKRWEERFERMEKQRKKDIQELHKELGRLSNKLGTIVEDIIFPASRPVLEKYFKCKISDISANREKEKDGIEGEFDIVAVSDKCKMVFIIEVKSTPRASHIEEFKEKMERFRLLFDEYKDYKLIPILASLRIKQNTVNALTKRKIYAMAYREWDYMDLLSFDKIELHA